MSPLFLRNLFYLINLDYKDFAAKASDINFTLRRQIALSGNPFTANRGMIRGRNFPTHKRIAGRKRRRDCPRHWSRRNSPVATVSIVLSAMTGQKTPRNRMNTGRRVFHLTGQKKLNLSATFGEQRIRINKDTSHTQGGRFYSAAFVCQNVLRNRHYCWEIDPSKSGRFIVTQVPFSEEILTPYSFP